MKSDDETAKLASTEEETRVEDEEESDSDNEGLWSVDEEDDDVERSPTINYSNMIEPGWDVDSYDGYECYDSDDRKSFSDDEEYEEFREFKFQAWKNKGFVEEDPFRSIFPLTDLERRFRNMTTREYLADIASLCVKKLNEDYSERQSKSRRWVEAVHHLYGSRVSGWSSCRVSRPWILKEAVNLPSPFSADQPLPH